MQRKKSDVKARTTLLLSLPDEHQLRFSKYKTAKEIWATILKTFGGNEATKKRKKNLLKRQYGNFKVEGSETLEQTFNRLNDLDTMSLDDLYNHLKHSSGDEDGNTTCVSTSSTTFPTASASVATISQDTASAYIASQSSGSQIKFEDINQIDKDNMEEIDIKWIMALLSMRSDKFWKRTGKKISIQGSDVAGFDKSKVECFNYHKMGHFARKCRAPRSQERGRKENYRQGTLEMCRESNLKCIKTLDKELETFKLEKDGLDGKLAGLLKSSKNLDNLIESQRSYKVKDGVGYNAVPPLVADFYLSPKKDLSWTGLPEFVDDTVTDYSRPSPTLASTSAEGQNKNSTTSKDVTSPNTPKPFVKFVKPKDIQFESKTNKHETPKKPQVKYAEQYRHSNKKPKVKGNQRNWNNLKSYQLGPEFVLKKKACFNCSNFSHFSNECRKRVQRETTRSAGHRPHGASMRPSHRHAGHRPHGPSMNPMRPNMNGARPNRSVFIQAHSYKTRHFLKSSAVKTQYRAPWVPTVNRNNPPVNRKFSTVRRNFPTVNRKFPIVSRKFTTGNTKIHTADMGRKGKAAKSSACWVWNPLQNLSNKGGCKITGKGTIKNGKLEFENVYFVKDLKYNLFSVSQICDNKNSVLFTDAECIVLRRNFKLLDDTNILLRTPRQHNMYSIDMNNIVLHKDLTCLVAKASADECIL
uniref:Ribonuclease H-like domain-containing protein n=1 Tax=Tanacetum cinerariifolium TaxID=118510 RepID=A0A699IFA2_TANCI|nr:ribonuclease H-like domain-containing protein [Tanacetum cinerariifolium]